ncbi:hypothetical protein AXG93_4371s1000 [Marchantia polymorpha subsp. ruderalis]|uniref:Uncharacterized protein n=1 Tax=Marchantia polymorpha subsp. ruderalis TaxID=1480154 RepID=A0A176VEU1_MARPO|nr:hypothetical protein AXG93_4371s1000 [Marchantia polymorpha subsp. ruderalis]
MISWQVGFVELALSGASIHWARFLWKATRQHAQEEKGGSINQISPFWINFYRSMECLTATERVQFPLLSRSNPGSADTGRAAERRNLPSSGEDASARVSGRTADLPTPKARTPLEEARRPSGQGRRHAAPTSVPATDRCFAFEQVPFDDSNSGQEPLAQAPSAQEKCREEPSAQMTSGQMPSAQTQLEDSGKDEGRKEETRVPSAQAPLAIADWAGDAGPPEARSPTALKILAGSGAAVAAEEATRPSSRVSPRIFVATEILDLEDESSSEGREVEWEQGTPTGVLCEQVVRLLQYLDRKAAKYADPRHKGSYVELVRNQTRIKVATNPELISLDRKYRELEEKNNALQGHLTLSRKLQKAVL